MSTRIKTLNPDTTTGKSQWYFMTFMSLVFGVVTLLASLHPTDNVVDSRSTYISKTVANSIMLVFSSTFGLMFTFCVKIGLIAECPQKCHILTQNARVPITNGPFRAKCTGSYHKWSVSW